ncbi:MAG TPA: hypothetical protein VLZ03_15435 [Thermodesulfobacteriota bacterium]|nr:hypothetical protein [Thermodesulfobacteriota bacterium]
MTGSESFVMFSKFLIYAAREEWARRWVTIGRNLKGKDLSKSFILFNS